MSEENKAVILEEGNDNNLDVLNELMAPDVFNHIPVPEHQRGI